MTARRPGVVWFLVLTGDFAREVPLLLDVRQITLEGLFRAGLLRQRNTTQKPVPERFALERRLVYFRTSARKGPKGA